MTAHPVTLFTGQWADLPLEEVAKLASGWGYDGLELACWGDHLDVWRAAEDDAYAKSRLEILDALANYSGAVVLVSHDEGAVEALNPERVLIMPDGQEDHWNPGYLDLITLA